MKSLLQFLGNMKVRPKLMLIYSCISFFPFLFFGFFFYNQASSLLQEEADLSDKNTITQSVASMDTKLEVFNNLSDYLSFNQVLASTLSQGFDDPYILYEETTSVVDPYLNTIPYFHPEVHSVTIYCETFPVSHGDYLAPYSLLEQELWYDKLEITSSNSWYYDEQRNLLYGIRSMPLLERNGMQAVLLIALEADQVFSPFVLDELDGYSIQIQNSEGDTFYTYTQASSTDATKELQNPDRIQQVSSSQTDWSVSFYRTDNETSRTLVLLGLSTLMALIVIFLISAFALDRIADTMILQPLSKLQKGMQSVEDGNLDVDLIPEYHDEIGFLTRSFLSMSHRLSVLINEVYTAKLQEKEYELTALQHQINPHFLYNTLSMINFKALAAGEDDISQITLSLSNFYRTSLNKGKKTCAFSDELNNIRSYLQIQLMMHDDSFQTDYDIDDSLQDAMCLPLILQPIVENAIEHGLDLIEDDRIPMLHIYAARNGEDVLIFVEDNGIGMDEELCKTVLEQQSKGYGMRNVHQRIKLYYGEQYGLTVRSIPGEGTYVTVRFPYRTS